MTVDSLGCRLAEAPRSIEWQGSSRETLIVDDSRLPIFWSYNYVKFSDFAILSNTTGEWVVKPDPDSGRALRVRISRSSLYPATRIEIIAKTIVNYELRNPNGIRLLRLT